MRPVVRERIGRHAKPGGIVVHVVAYPTGRLLDKLDASPDGVDDADRGDLYVELRDDETGVAMVAYDGDTGRRIRPPKPMGKFERAFGRFLCAVTEPIAWVAFAINLALLAYVIGSGPSVWSLLNGFSLGVSIACIHINRRRRRLLRRG